MAEKKGSVSRQLREAEERTQETLRKLKQDNKQQSSTAAKDSKDSYADSLRKEFSPMIDKSYELVKKRLL